jgi:hypothetical protein
MRTVTMPAFSILVCGLIGGRVNLSSILRWRVGAVVHGAADAFVAAIPNADGGMPIYQRDRAVAGGKSENRGSGRSEGLRGAVLHHPTEMNTPAAISRGRIQRKWRGRWRHRFLFGHGISCAKSNWEAGMAQKRTRLSQNDLDKMRHDNEQS